MQTRIRTTLFMAAVVLLAVACTGKFIRKTTDYHVSSSAEVIARGKYIVDGPAACGGCHTPRVGGDDLAEERPDAYLAGGQRFKDTRAGYNLLMPQIGSWSDDQIRRAIRDGVDKEGHFLNPLMPYGSYEKMSDADVDAVVAYLRSIPPIKRAVDVVHQKNGAAGFAMMMGMVQHKPAENVAAPSATDKVAQGRYVANGLGFCWACHSLTGTGPKESNNFAGSTVAFTEPSTGKVWARNLTPDPDTGIGKYTDDQLKDSIKNSHLLDGGKIARPMSFYSAHYAKISDADLDAMVAYFRSLPPAKHKVPARELTGPAKTALGL
jgi:mono/diheme cytochrome c family protein